MATSKQERRRRRRQILGAGVRSLGRGVLYTLPGTDRAENWHRTGQDWYNTLGNLKGAAMKMGQIASQYRDFMPPEVAEQLARLQRDADPWPFEKLLPVLESQWDAAQFAQVEDIDHQAMAAASIGQVHRARLVDGTDIAIKIRYPGIADAVDADIANLARLFRMARFIPARGRDIDAIMAELRERFIEETDYRQELAHLKTLRSMALPGYALPEPVAALCTDAVIVTTLLESAPIDTAPPEIGQTLCEGICRQFFTHGIIHADPHPGNFGYTADGRIALYDFGCIKYFDAATRRHITAIIAAGLNEDWYAMHCAMEALGVVPRKSWASHKAVYADIYARHTLAPLSYFRKQPAYTFADDGLLERIRREVSRSLRYWRRFNAAPDLVFLMRTLSGLYWIMRRVQARAPMLALLEDVAEGRFDPTHAPTETRH